jgi:uncharacterized protein YbjQ (UPF0145 family)
MTARVVAAGGTLMLVTTTNDLPGRRIKTHLGLVRGLSVRSRNVFSNLGGAVQTLFGGSLSIYRHLAEQARQEAYDKMVEHAREMGADAVIAMRYDANEMASTVTEVLAYGTAVVLEDQS